MWRIVYFLQNTVPELWRFIRHIPGYYRLETRQQGYEPETYHFIIQQYEEVLMDLTGGMMSKPTYYARDIIPYINDRYCEGCEYRERCEEDRHNADDDA